MGWRDVECIHSVAHRRQQVVLSKDEASAGDTERVAELVGRVRGIGAGEDATGSNDGEEEDGVRCAVEGVDADAVAGLEACVAEASDEVAD